jgi:hypothetical protein
MGGGTFGGLFFGEYTVGGLAPTVFVFGPIDDTEAVWLNGPYEALLVNTALGTLLFDPSIFDPALFDAWGRRQPNVRSLNPLRDVQES